MQLHVFPFNPFQVNTFVLRNEAKEAWVIDPGMYGEEEERQFSRWIEEEGLSLQACLLTHAHVDHCLGVAFLRSEYGLPLWAHPDTAFFLDNAPAHGRMYGFDVKAPGLPDVLLEEGLPLVLGGTTVQLLHTPGHADGSLCYFLPSRQILIAGDVLFRESIGRTDLPTGDFDTLIRNIREKLLSLPPDTRVYPGHGPATSIQHEIRHNPFLQ
jgi:glyoxylase-like metal-dependent hydrolase (beta-lactamase superfamily II)